MLINLLLLAAKQTYSKQGDNLKYFSFPLHFFQNSFDYSIAFHTFHHAAAKQLSGLENI